jgi:hypothetical protein
MLWSEIHQKTDKLSVYGYGPQTSDLGIAGSSPAKVIGFSSNCEECQGLRSEIHQKTNKLSVYGYGPCAT